MSSLLQLKAALKGTSSPFISGINRLFRGKPSLDEASLESLQELMIGADIGVTTTEFIIQAVRDKASKSSSLNGEQIRHLIKRELLNILNMASNTRQKQFYRPYVVMVEGANGVGKTTTIAKLAYRYQQQGHKVLLSAADTFRAAAIEQLQIWAQRVGCPVIKHKPPSDPAAVVFDSLSAARTRGYDIVIVDTAGRLHTKHNLMNELEKIRKVISRQVEGAPQEVLLVLDATIGQNAIVQAEEFLKFSGVNGIALAKLDGTAKGGVIVAIAKLYAIPIRYVGVGEGLEDLVEFSPDEFVEALLGEG